jgi:hypothetical protein
MPRDKPKALLRWCDRLITSARGANKGGVPRTSLLGELLSVDMFVSSALRFLFQCSLLVVATGDEPPDTSRCMLNPVRSYVAVRLCQRLMLFLSGSLV